MAPTTPSLDIVSVAIALSAAIFGPDTAQLVGPYVVIFLGAVLGAAVSASRQEQSQSSPRIKTLSHILMMVLAALLVTVPFATFAASIVAPWLSTVVEPKFLFAPMAFAISVLGPDGWTRAFMWALRRKANPPPPNDPPPTGGNP